MKYFLVLFVFGILCQNTLASGLGHPVFNDFERRLVRLEERQFSESENLEHRMLKLETKQGTQLLSIDEISVRENPAEGMNFHQRLEKLEKNWEKELEEQLVKFSSKYENLAERFSAIEKHVEEHKSSVFDQIKESQNTAPEESKSTPHEEPESDKSKDVKFLKVSGKRYHIINSEKKNWLDAEEKCLEMHAHLVSLQNQTEWLALVEYLGQDSYWTDINDRDKENRFTSIYGDDANFLMWDEGEPNATIDNEDCVELKAKSGYKMNDASCNDQKNFICEIFYPEWFENNEKR